MDDNTPSLFIDSPSPEYLANPEKHEYETYRTLTYDYCLPTRITKCPHCGHEGLHVHKNLEITLKHASTFIDLIQLRVHYHSYRCPKCRRLTRDTIPMRCGDTHYTFYYKAQVLRVLEDYGMTLKKCAKMLRASDRQVKEIKFEALNLLAGDLKPTHYSRYIAIDEFLLEHPHRYCTIVIDAETGELLYLEKGKSKAQVEGFMKFVGDDFMKHVEAVVMDMNNTYYPAISKAYPHIDLNYDPFHLVQWYQDKVMDGLRKTEYKRLKKEADKAAEEGRIEDAADLMAQAKKMFDSRFILMTSRTALEAKDKANKKTNEEYRERCKELGIEPPEGHKDRRENNVEVLDSVLKADEKIATAFTLGNELREIIHIRNMEEMTSSLEDWVKTAQNSKIAQLTRFANTILSHWEGIINMAKHGLSTGILEGTNCFIKNMRRSAFGYTDFDFFGLLIWEHTHLSAAHKKAEATRVKKVYKKRTRKNEKPASKQTIYIKERDKFGKIIAS
jgi:transposase